ncbi:MAG: TetR-like C-terminal domain-containing protein [Rivularia sp. (in: cyanobacteria)]
MRSRQYFPVSSRGATVANQIAVSAFCSGVRGAESPPISVFTQPGHMALTAILSIVNPEIAFPDTGSVKEDFRTQMYKIVKLMNSSRGEILATVIGCGQMEDELISAFRENWLLPRRDDAKRIFQRGVVRGELRRDVDAEVAIDALYSPLFYRLLLKHLPLNEAFVDELIDIVMKGLVVKN